MNIKELVTANRSYRRFHQDIPVAWERLEQLIELARLSPSARNRQPLKYLISNTAADNQLIFDHLSWAGDLEEWSGPAEGARPAAYILILGDREISNDFGVDHGITAQTIKLGATEMGLGGCIVGSIKRRELRLALGLPEQFEILLVIALGTPREEVVLERVGSDGNTTYWRDDQEIHHVPKRTLEELIVEKEALLSPQRGEDGFG